MDLNQKKILSEIGIISGFIIIVIPVVFGLYNGLLITSLLGCAISWYSSFHYGCSVFQEKQIQEQIQCKILLNSFLNIY